MTATDPATTPPETPDGFITHRDMQEHRRNGLAKPLSRIITDFLHYDDQWWIADHHGWHLIDDKHLVVKLDNHGSWAEGDFYLGGGA